MIQRKDPPSKAVSGRRAEVEKNLETLRRDPGRFYLVGVYPSRGIAAGVKRLYDQAGCETETHALPSGMVEVYAKYIAPKSEEGN